MAKKGRKKSKSASSGSLESITQTAKVMDPYEYYYQTLGGFSFKVIAALKEMVGLDEQEFNSFLYVMALHDSGMDIVEKELAYILDAPHRPNTTNIHSHVEKLKGHANRYDRALDALLGNPAAQKVFSMDYSENDLRSALALQGVALKDSDTVDTSLHLGVFYELTIGIGSYLDFFSPTFNPVSEMLVQAEGIEKLIKADPKNGTSYYNEDQGVYLVKESIGIDRLSANTFTEKTIDAMDKFYSGLSYAEMRKIAVEGNERIAFYIEVAKARLLENVSGWSSEEMPRYRLVPQVAAKLEALAGLNVPLQVVSELVKAAPVEQQQEVLDTLVQQPEHGFAYNQLRRVGVKPSNYVQFMLHYADLRLDVAGKTACVEYINTIADKSLGAAKALVETNVLWVIDSKIPTLLETILVYPQGADEYVQAYLEAAADPTKQSVIIYLAQQSLIPSDRKEILRGLERITEEELAFQLKDRELTYRTIKNVLATPSAQTHAITQTVTKREPWINVLTHQYIDIAAELEEAYGILVANSSEDKMRNIWKTQPNHLRNFARDVLGNNSAWYFIPIIQNPALFEIYKEWRSQTTAHLHTAFDGIEADNDNTYSLIRNALKASKSEIENNNSKKNLDSLNEEIPPQVAPNINKIIIWGGRYESSRQENIRNEFPGIDIRFHDIYTRPKALHPEDKVGAVIISTPGTPHSLSETVVAMCKRREIPLYYAHQTGVGTITSLIYGIGK